MLEMLKGVFAIYDYSDELANNFYRDYPCTSVHRYVKNLNYIAGKINDPVM